MDETVSMWSFNNVLSRDEFSWRVNGLGCGDVFSWLGSVDWSWEESWSWCGSNEFRWSWSNDLGDWMFSGRFRYNSVESINSICGLIKKGWKWNQRLLRTSVTYVVDGSSCSIRFQQRILKYFREEWLNYFEIVLASFINAEIPVWDEESQLTSAMAYIPKKTEFN